MSQVQEFSRKFLDLRWGRVLGLGEVQVAAIMDHERAGDRCEQAHVETGRAVLCVFAGV